MYWLLLVPVAVAAVSWAIARHSRGQWERWPSRDAYASQHPQCASPVRCHACGSAELTDIGWADDGDHRRLHACSACCTFLYRTE